MFRWSSMLIYISVAVFLIVDGQSTTGDSERVDHVERELAKALTRIENLEAKLSSNNSDPSPVGVTYIRWGRTECATTGATLLYSGHAAGKHKEHSGGGTNQLCLPEEPQWNGHSANAVSNGEIAGIFYWFSGNQAELFSTVNYGGHSVHYRPAPCAVCYVPRRSASLMIPARTSCPVGWTQEFTGYLMSDDTKVSNRLPTQYICVDGAPEVASGALEHQAILLPVKVACGILPCSMYHNGWELACVVCTK